MSTREFDDIVKQKAQRRQADVPPDIWENISNRKKKKRKPLFWLVLLALLAGSSVAVWRIKNSRNDMAAVAVEKIKADKTNVGNKKGQAPVDESNNNQTSVLNKIKSSDEKDGKTTAILTDGLATTNNPVAEKRKTLMPLSKQQRISVAVFNNTDEKIFLPIRNKRNTKGKYKATTQNAAADALAGARNTKDIIEKDAIKSGQLQENSVQDLPDVTTGSVNNTIATTSDTSKTNPAAMALANQVELKQSTQAGKNNMDKKETAATKSTHKQKNTSLKIEAAAILLFPIQHYEQPQRVQRLLNSANTSASFTSDKSITSMIESGNGFSLGLIKQLNKKWSIGTGMSLMRFTERLQMHGNETSTEYRIVQRLKEGPNGLYLAPDTVSNSSTYSTTLFGRNIYHNTGIPLFARYRFIAGKKISCEFAGGFTVNLLRKYSNNIPGEFTTVYADGSKQTGMKNTLGIDAFAGLLVSGRLHRELNWFASANYVYNISSYSTLFKNNIHLPGISVGVLHELRKR